MHIAGISPGPTGTIVNAHRYTRVAKRADSFPRSKCGSGRAPALLLITRCCGCRQPQLLFSNEVGVLGTGVSDRGLVMTYAPTWHGAASPPSSLVLYTTMFTWFRLWRMLWRPPKLGSVIRSCKGVASFVTVPGLVQKKVCY